jgi:arsenite methyltransferase
MADKLKIEQVRDDVSKAYAKAVTTGSGCCGGGATEVKGAVALLAGYSDEELRTLPQDAASNAFGCGNPVAMSEIGEGEVVLDLGSGAGIDILLAARKVGPTGKVIGVDMTYEMLARAEENIAASGLDNVEVRKGIIEAMPVADAAVDWVISNCVINLSPEKPRVFAEIARVLKPGGRMLVSDIVAEDLPEWVLESSELYSSCVSGAIGEQEYIAGLQAAGLTDVEVRARLVYDSSQLKAFVADDVAPLEQSCCAGSCCAPEGKEQIEEGLQQVEGKIWSAKFFARKA